MPACAFGLEYLYKRNPSPVNQRIMMIPAVNPADRSRVNQWSWRKTDERQAQEGKAREEA
jgi:hypothetical protein